MLNLSVGGEITLLRWVGFYENGYSRSFFSKNGISDKKRPKISCNPFIYYSFG